MIKIVEIICALQNGGVETMLYNYLCNIDKKDYEIDIIAYGKANEIIKKRFENIGCRIIEITPKKTNLRKSLKELYSFLKEGNYDIVHTHMNINNSIPLVFAKILKIPKRISHSHAAKDTRQCLKKIYEQINKFIIRILANQYLACGEEAAIYLYGKKMFFNHKVTILKNAIDLEKYKYNDKIRKEIRAEYGIKDNNILLGHVGRFTYQKNHIFLIELLKRLNNPNFKMMLIGDGELKLKIIAKVNEYQLNDSVIFLENITNMHEYLSAMDIFLLPSNFEGLPLVGVEAQANGVKCLFSSNIDKRLKINSNVKILDLNLKKWIKECKIEERIESEKNLREHGYDIKEQAKKLSHIYNEGMNKSGNIFD